MKYITLILDELIKAAQNKWVWFRLLVLVAVGFAGAILFSKTKINQQDCSYYIEQNKLLVGALIEIKNALQPVATSYFEDGSNDFIYASLSVLDTVPKGSVQVKIVISKIDSILLEIKKQDSIKNLKTKQ